MQILLRKYDGEEYVWKKGTYENEVYYIEDDGRKRIFEHNIAAVKDNEYADYVVCTSCGQIVKNTPEEIEKHYVEMENSRDCAKCEYVKFANRGNVVRSIVEEDGIYHVTENFIASPRCGVVSWSLSTIEHAVEKGFCMFVACRKKGMRKLNSIFMKYPGVFDTVITADALQAKKYRFDGHNGEYFLYDMKSRGTIKACVNKAGIVDSFLVSSGGHKMYFRYSEKYDKMFYSDGYKYEEGKPYWFKEAKFNEAYQKIKALYEGADE